MSKIRIIGDITCIVLMLVLTAYVLYQEQALHNSFTREHEMFVLANRLDQQAQNWEQAAINYEQAATNFREAALSCIARDRKAWHPLLEQQPFNAGSWKLPLGVVEK